MLGKFGHAELARGLLIELGWVIVLFAANRIAFARAAYGAYSAFGGSSASRTPERTGQSLSAAADRERPSAPSAPFACQKSEENASLFTPGRGVRPGLLPRSITVCSGSPMAPTSCL